MQAEESQQSDSRADADVDAGSEENATSWTEHVHLQAFVDAYASANFNFPGIQSEANDLRAFDRTAGFALAWAGADVGVDMGPAGATLSLRLGPATNAGWADPAVPGIQHIKQAYATWRVADRFVIDFGRFDTIYGAEVAESWQNHTYTRGMLYNLAQPFWHTGVRGSAQIIDPLALNLMVVNGWGHIADNNRGKTFGAQIVIEPIDGLGLYLGYLTGPEYPEVDDAGTRIVGPNDDFRHLVDLVVTLDIDALSMAFNADYVYDDAPAAVGPASQWYGVMISGRYAILPWLAAGVRGEFLGDPDGWMTGATDPMLGTASATLDLQPVPHLIVRLEGRFDGATEPLFGMGFDDTSTTQVTATLGVVVSSF